MRATILVTLVLSTASLAAGEVSAHANHAATTAQTGDRSTPVAATTAQAGNPSTPTAATTAQSGNPSAPTAAAQTAPTHKVAATRPTHAPRMCRGMLTLPTHSDHALIDSAIMCLIDRERIANRLPALRPNRELQGIASSLADEMALAGYFGDDTISGQSPWQRIASSPYAVGARVLSAAQNIGWGTGGLATPQGVVEEWMHSPPHRQIILTRGYRDVGAGAAPVAPSSVTNEKPGATYTLELATRAG